MGDVGWTVGSIFIFFFVIFITFFTTLEHLQLLVTPDTSNYSFTVQPLSSMPTSFATVVIDSYRWRVFTVVTDAPAVIEIVPKIEGIDERGGVCAKVTTVDRPDEGLPVSVNESTAALPI